MKCTAGRDYNILIEQKIREYMEDKRLSEDDIKKNGQRIAQPSSGKEAFFYNGECILTAQNNLYDSPFEFN